MARAERGRQRRGSDKQWGEENVNYHFGHLLEAGDNTWSKVRRLAMKELDIQVAVGRIRDAVYWRLTHSRPGRSSELYPVAADLEKTQDEELPATDSATIAAAGYAVDDKGWLVSAERMLPIQAVDEEDDSPLSSPPADLEEGGGGDDKGRRGDLANRKSDVRLGQSNLPERASPDAYSSDAGNLAPADTPSTGMGLD
jgi:hypothetical protein